MESRIEMHLVSQRPQRVEILGETFWFNQGETIHTECSYKYTPEQFENLTYHAGFNKKSFWTDEKGYFGVGLFEVR